MIETDTIYAIAVLLGIIVIPICIVRSSVFSDINVKKRAKLANDYIHELEGEIDAYKKEVRSLKNKANAAERGPHIEGDMSDLSSLIPEVLPQFESYAPKWLKPFLGNKQMQAVIGKYIQENPDKAADMFGKLVGRQQQKNNSQDAGMSI